MVKRYKSLKMEIGPSNSKETIHLNSLFYCFFEIKEYNRISMKEGDINAACKSFI